FQNQNTYTGLTDIENGTLELMARQNIGPVLIRENGHLDMYTSQNFAALSVGGHARLLPGGNKVLVLTSLEITDQGQLDLADNKMTVDGTVPAISQIRHAIAAGYAGGAWNGPGVISSTAAASLLHDGLGYGLAGDLGLTTFGGEHVDPTSIVVRYTYL